MSETVGTPLRRVSTGQCTTCVWERAVHVYNNGQVEFVITRDGSLPDSAACSTCEEWQDLNRESSRPGGPFEFLRPAPVPPPSKDE